MALKNIKIKKLLDKCRSFNNFLYLFMIFIFVYIFLIEIELI